LLFNSYAFIFLFFPIVFAGMFWIGRYSHRLAALWLGLSSLTFYSVWDSGFVLLLLASICFNYGAGYFIGHSLSLKKPGLAKLTLIFSIVANLSLLAYFKYMNFFMDSVNQLFGMQVGAFDIILPLGISFFTFTQMAYLVDVYRGIAREYNFIHYLLFVTYFPHLIAGPILHHKQMMPQFGAFDTYRMNADNVAVGLSIFILGLAKKVLIADQLAHYVTPIFTVADTGGIIMFFEAWVAALAYTLQLYFDFSAYCDMAIGLSLMLNIRLPMNFNSPYKATSMIDFWRRWHMTLSAFLRNYLYIPLGGNRRGPTRRYANLMITMLLGGLWHGAGWTFVIWGGLHGFYLMINLGWRELKTHHGWGHGGKIANLGALLLTFLAVVVAWVFFRAETFSGAYAILTGMAGMNGISLPEAFAGKYAFLTYGNDLVLFAGLFPNTHLNATDVLVYIVSGLAMVWFLPNMREMFSHYNSTWEDLSGTLAPFQAGKRVAIFTWKPTRVMAMLLSLLFVFCVFSLTKISEFLYFQF